MSMGQMSQLRSRAWLSAVIWTIAGIGFLWTFLSGGGAEELPTDGIRHAAGAGAIGFGFLGHGLALWMTRQREGAPPVSDERDFRTLAQANQVTLIVVLLGIYIFTISLWLRFEAEGVVPVAWMWFLAYGSAILAFLASSVITLILDRRSTAHG
jgi:hypothetical protein